MNLSNAIKITKVAAGAGSAGTDVNGETVDMSGYDGVVFFATIATANAGNFIKVQQGVNANGSGASDLAGTKVVAAENAQVVWVDVYRPLESQGKYLRPVIDRGGTNTVTGDIYALQYSGRVSPQSNLVATKVVGELHISPATGTA